MPLKSSFFGCEAVFILAPKSKWEDLIIITIASINMELISFLALSRYFKFTALFNLYHISRKHCYIDTNFEIEEPRDREVT